MGHPRKPVLLALLISAPLVAGMPGLAAAMSVNRCVVEGRVLYTDQPCQKAEVIAIDAGGAAPDARERLRRDQEALDQRAAARRDAVAQEAAMARFEPARAPEAPQPPAAGDDTVYDFAWSPLGARRNAVRHRPDNGEDERRRRKSVIQVPPPTPLRGSRH